MPTEETDRPEPTATREAVRRDITIDAPAERIWDAIRSDEARGAWLDDDDATGRTVRVDDETAPEHLSWTWWRTDEPGDATRVSFDLDRLDDGRTRVTVIEQPAAPATTGTLDARASAGATPAPTSAVAASGTWHSRLVALELRLVVMLAVGVA